MTRPLPRWPRRPLAVACMAAIAAPLQAQTAPATTLPAVEVIATTPVPGTGVPRDQIPSNVQTANDRRLRQLQSLNLPDFMGSQLGSVNVNEIAAALKAAGFHITTDQVRLEGPLKELGLYTVKIHLHADIEAELKVWVVPTAASEAPAEKADKGGDKSNSDKAKGEKAKAEKAEKK